MLLVANHNLLGFAGLLPSSARTSCPPRNAIATTARNPVSGMTMLTIIISSVVLLRFGLNEGFVWMQELYVWTHAMTFLLAAALFWSAARERSQP